MHASRSSFCRLKIVASTLLLLLGAGCSNPLSSSKNDHLQNFHSKNVNCDELRFSNNSISNAEVRSLTHCLNAHGEIDAFETLLDSVSDAELTPVSTLINNLLTRQPRYAYTLRGFYRRSDNNGDLKALEQILAKLLNDPAKNTAFVKAFQKISDPLIAALFDQTLDLSQSNAFAILRSKAYQRLGGEYFESDSLKQFVLAANHYVKSADAKSLRTLYGFIVQGGLDTAWTKLISQNEQAHVQNIAHFFEWLTQQDHYGIVSRSLRQMNQNSVKCFGGKVTIPNPAIEVIKQVSLLDSASVKPYLGHDIQNRHLLAQAYCEFPYQSDAVLKVLDDATDVRGFDEVFILIKPLLANSEFIEFMASKASEDFVSAIGKFSNQHFFEDLFTLVTLHLQNPISNDGSKIAALLDDALKPLSDQDVQAALDFLAPVLTAREYYAARLNKIIYHMSYGFPGTKPEISTELRTSLKVSFHAILNKPAVTDVFNLGAQLIGQGKLNGIIDQILTYLNDLVERGKFTFPTLTVKDPAGFSLPSATYLLEKISDSARAPDPCDALNYDWNFASYSTQNSGDYLQQLNLIQTCINPNQTFASAKDLITYSISKSNYPALLRTQRGALNTLLGINTNLAIDSAEHFLSIGQNDSNTIRKMLDLGSSTLALIKDSYLSKPDLRKMMADVVSAPELYSAAGELTNKIPTRTRSSQPTVDLINLSKINAIVSRDLKLTQVPVEDAVKAIMLQYCPALSDSCGIDSDQVALYRKSPKLLYQQIAQEELDSVQSWIHPKMATGWKHQSVYPADVSTFEYHFNPTLHLLSQSPQAPQGVLNALTRTQQDKIGVAKFLKERAVRFTLIPYVYQVPNYPAQTGNEYTARARIRLVNDLDRLELISINADFRAFGRVSNIGMGFLREIALAWGDVPFADRPKSLSKFVDPYQVLTLRDVRDSIQADMSHYDSNTLQNLGSACNGGWWARRFCNGEVADISSRVFNLRFLISLLSEELPAKDGGKDGLIFLRDLFYSLYEMNTDYQRDQFANGVDLSQVCMENPLKFSGPQQICQIDLMTFVPRIAHLGLLHQAGIAIVQAQDHPIDAIGSVLDRVTANKELSNLFVNVASSKSGIQFLTDAVDYGFQAPEGTGKNLSLLTQMLAVPRDLNWASLAFELGLQDPHFPAENKELINSLFTINAANLAPRVDQWVNHENLPTPQLLELLSEKLTPSVRKDIINFLTQVTPESASFAKYLTSAKNLPELDDDRLKNDLHQWAGIFATAELAPARRAFGDWTKSSDFNQFCDVFSDSLVTTKAYNFLESISHNPDAQHFVESCRDFLILH